VYVADLDGQPDTKELRKICDENADIWKRVGLELGLKPHELKIIELNNPKSQVHACLDMLEKWKSKNTSSNASRRILHHAIKCCRANKGRVFIL